ncbi:MAG: L,D-transpeptidase [Acidobacteriota bacterium]
MRFFVRTLTGVVCLFLFSGCNPPPVPSEIEEAEIQVSELRGAGAEEFFSARFNEHLSLMSTAKDRFFKVRARLPVFRNYDEIRIAFQEIVSRGEAFLNDIRSFKATRTASASERINSLTRRMKIMNRVGSLLQSGRFVRFNISRAELLLQEADLLIKKGRFEEGQSKLDLANNFARETQAFLLSTLDRYDDPKNLKNWRALALEAAAGGKGGSPSILINKLDQSLTVYRNGKTWKTFTISLGANGFFDKRHAGDYATPEGRYVVVSKNPASRFHLALLLNYPNPADREAYLLAREKGLIPPAVGIGGLIEIHGGGNDIRTDGCITLRDKDMDILYGLIEPGASVTIIGSLHSLTAVINATTDN